MILPEDKAAFGTLNLLLVRKGLPSPWSEDRGKDCWNPSDSHYGSLGLGGEGAGGVWVRHAVSAGPMFTVVLSPTPCSLLSYVKNAIPITQRKWKNVSCGLSEAWLIPRFIDVALC